MEIYSSSAKQSDPRSVAQAKPETPSPSGIPSKQRRGFALNDRETQRQISRMGGQTAHERGRAHQFTSEEARDAGRKGGASVSEDRAHMAEIGRQGGRQRGRRMRLADSHRSVTPSG